MNLEHLKKLIALATKNPNEHEANSAARRVCKMLAEAMEKGELNWNVRVASKPPNIPYTQSNQSTDEWLGFKRAYNDVRRSTEPEFKSRPSNTSNTPPKWENPFKGKTYESVFYDEVFPDDIYEQLRNAARAYNSYDTESQYQKANREQVNRDSPIYEQGPFGAKRERVKQEKKPLECSKCHQIRDTIFVGHPSLFICQECVWSDFEKERSAQK